MFFENITASVNDTQRKILDGAIECVKQWGVEKTSLNDIAKAAKVTRPTVYSYYENRDEVIKSSLLHAGYHFSLRLLAHIDQFQTSAERLVEAVALA